MNTLMAANPAWLPLFAILLGANDSAAGGTNNNPYTGSLPAPAYTAKMQALVSQLLADFPACKISVNVPGIPTRPTSTGTRTTRRAG